MDKKTFFKRNIDFSDVIEMETCVKYFSTEEDFSLNSCNFKDMMNNLLTDSDGMLYVAPQSMLTELFNYFDKNEDGKLDLTEFRPVWNEFIKPLVKPISALLIIDVQNDFIDGSLALKNCPAKKDGKNVIPVINKMLDELKFDAVAYSFDWHPEKHISFIENVNHYKLSNKNNKFDKISVFDTVLFEGPPEISQKLWPAHCIQNSWGSKLHNDLKVALDSIFVYKGTNSKIDSYSAFFDNLKISQTNLHEDLQKRNITHVFICGLAFEICVANTAIDAQNLGYATTVIDDAVEITDDQDAKTTVNMLKSQDCVLVGSKKIKTLLSGEDVKLEFASTFHKLLKKQMES